MKFEKPIVFIDLETTGVDIKKDRIVEISVVKYHDNKIQYDITQKINPGIPIPEQATAVHGISNDDVAFEPPFTHVAPMIIEHIEGCDIAGFNSNSFDLRMLFAEFARCGIYWDHRKHNLIDVGNMFKQLQPRTLSAAHLMYVGTEHEDAHGARADAIATANIFTAMMEQHVEQLPQTIEELALFSNFGKPILDLSGCFSLDENNEVIFAIGKHRTKKAKGEKDYLQWMLRADFNEDTKDIATQLLEEIKSGK